ncbi:MAG: glycosyl hydrolase family 18 protein [Flavobacteriales bacterium]|jgi:chitinase|tara:strand:+ start:840 stop:1844 length:1005 start_codon:yes stop_codon:yes gene_type:complete
MIKKLVLILLIFLVSCSKDSIEVEISQNNSNAKIVGYLPTWRFELSSKVEYCKLTHLNLAFANPDSNGSLIMPDISSVVADARSKNPNIKISISIGGGSLSNEQASNWSNLIDNSQNRSKVVSKIVDFVLLNNLDGVDVDLEWNYVTSGYSPFVVDLNNALDQHTKMITAALPATTRYSNLSDNALSAFDFINIMSYDFTGPWNPNVSGQHSSYNHAKESIEFWKKSIGLSKDKLVLGVPFYGYDFNNSSAVSAFTFSSIVNQNNSYADIDNVGLKYYNGRPTIRSKVQLASNEVSGIMVWEIGQDSYSEYSLLKTIHKEYDNLGTKTTELCKE